MPQIDIICLIWEKNMVLAGLLQYIQAHTYSLKKKMFRAIILKEILGHCADVKILHIP